MKQTTKQRIYWYLKNNGRVSGSQLEKMADEWMTKPSVISRRCRELAHDGIIYRSIGEKGTVQYSLSPPPMTVDQANQYLETLRQGELV